ncbi:MAG: helix-turn-helix domain-containing protein [Clostridia bacterium]|nr:helix-turn-helix domain-containing protein [Clostridia bacterium]
MYDNIKFVHGGRFNSRGLWCHPDRSIEDTEIIVGIRGEFRISCAGQEYKITPGDVLRISPSERHYGIEPTEHDISFYWVHFTGASDDELPPRYFRPEAITQTELIIRQILHYASTEGYPRESMDFLVRLLIIELKAEYLRLDADNHPLFSTVKEWVRVNCDLPIKVSDVAVHFRYNEDYLNRVFRRFYPAGLKAFIDEQKLQRIKDSLLNDSLTLQEIAAKYGFSDYKYFLKFFKYHEGISPTGYRQMYCNLHTNNR